MYLNVAQINLVFINTISLNFVFPDANFQKVWDILLQVDL